MGSFPAHDDAGEGPGREGSPTKSCKGTEGGKKPGLRSHDSVLPSALSQDVFQTQHSKGLLPVLNVGLNESREKGTEEILGTEASGLLRRAELTISMTRIAHTDVAPKEEF